MLYVSVFFCVIDCQLVVNLVVEVNLKKIVEFILVKEKIEN